MVKYFKIEETLEIPDDVEIKIQDGKIITIKGAKGSITKDFNHMKGIELNYKDKVLHLSAYFARKGVISKIGTLKSLVNNMCLGVTHGYTYKMKIAYSHFPITLSPPKTKNGGDEIQILNFLGERSPRTTLTAGPGITIKADKEDVVIEGIDKQAVSQTAANIQRRCRIRQKDKRVFQDGIWLYEKWLGKDELLWKLKA